MISRTADFGYSSAITALWLIFKTWIVWKTAVGLVLLLSFNCGFGLLRFWWWSDLSKEIGIYGCWTLLLKRASRLPSFRCSFWVFRGVFFWKHVETTISPCQKAENKRLTPILLGDKNLSFFRWLLDCIMAHQGRHFMDILEPTLGNLIREVIPGAPKRQKVGECWECFWKHQFYVGLLQQILWDIVLMGSFFRFFGRQKWFNSKTSSVGLVQTAWQLWRQVAFAMEKGAVVDLPHLGLGKGISVQRQGWWILDPLEIDSIWCYAMLDANWYIKCRFLASVVRIFEARVQPRNGDSWLGLGCGQRSWYRCWPGSSADQFVSISIWCLHNRC